MLARANKGHGYVWIHFDTRIQLTAAQSLSRLGRHQVKGNITVFEILQAGGVLIAPIMLCSVMAVAIIVERFWSLQTRKISPKNLLAQALHWQSSNQLTPEKIHALRVSSPLGRMLAAGLLSRHHHRTIIKNSIEDAGRYEVHELDRYLSTLGTIAAITPLLGLLGSVVGLMEVFNSMTSQGIGDPQALGSGISKIMIATAAGLVVAIPSLTFYRYFQRRVDELAIALEQEALKLLGALRCVPGAN